MFSRTPGAWGFRLKGGGSSFPYTLTRNVYSSRYIRPTTGESPLEVPLSGTQSTSVLKTRGCKFPSLTLHLRNRSLGNGLYESEKEACRSPDWQNNLGEVHACFANPAERERLLNNLAVDFGIVGRKEPESGCGIFESVSLW